MPEQPLVSIIVLTLNGRDVVPACLDSLLVNDYPNLEILVVNNGSRDGVDAVIARDYPAVRLISLPANFGYAGGMNEGIKAARGEILIPLNDDTVSSPSLVREIVQPLLDESSIGIVGAKILYPDGKTIQHAGAWIRANGGTNHFGYAEEDRGQYDEMRDVDYVTGCAIAIRRRLFEQLGLYDDRYFPTYYEEVEFAVRARKAGWRVVYNPRATLLHLESKTEVVNSPRFLYRYNKSRLRFLLKNFSKRELLRAVREEVRWWPQISGDSVIPLIKAYGATAVRLPSILHDRKRRFLPLSPLPATNGSKTASLNGSAARQASADAPAPFPPPPREGQGEARSSASPSPLDRDVKQFSSDKIFKHIDRVNDWLEGGNPYPVTMELDMTNCCPHGCPECVCNYFRESNRDFIPGELAERIVRELADCRVRGLIFTGGGEPLASQWTRQTIELASSLGMDVALITNGTLLNERNMGTILDRCVWTRVSLDAITTATFEKMHGLGKKHFRRVIENIKALARRKKETDSRCTVGVGFLTCEATAGEMVEAARTVRDWGVDYLQFRPLQIHHGGQFDYHWLAVDERIDEACSYSTDGYQVLFSKHKYEMIKRRDYGRTYGKCYGQQFASTIAADAKVYVCCHTRGYEKYCLGDLREQSFAEIWNSERRRRVADNIDFRDCIPLCRDNPFNQILWNIKQNREHPNFL